MKVEQVGGSSLSLLCSLSGYSRQAYYKRRLQEEQVPLQYELVIQQVLEYRQLQPRLGGRKLFLLTGPFRRQHGIAMGRDAFFRMLDRYGLLSERKRNKPRTTDSGHWMKKYPNLVVGLAPTASDQLWVSDITYLSLTDRDAFLSLVTDAYSRKIIGFHVSGNLSAHGPVRALQMAISGRTEIKGLIHHSDRGVQYCCAHYVNELKACGIAISMTQGGDPRDNAIAERVNGILKMELLEPVFKNLPAVIGAVSQAVYIYNYLRPHSSLSMLTPALVHGRELNIRRCWKNYYRKRKENNPDLVIHKKGTTFKKKKRSKKRKTCLDVDNAPRYPHLNTTNKP